MNQLIYLRCDSRGVVAMTKSLPSLYKDEVIIKLNVKVADKVFGNPTIEQEISVEDWASDIDVGALSLDRVTITPAEAETLRQGRILAMKKVLEAQGFNVTEKTGDES